MVQSGSIAALLLDFDGTLVSLNVDWDGARRDLRRLFRRWGVESPFRPLNPDLARALADLAAAGVPESDVAEARAEAYRILRRREVEAAGTARPLPGAPELLRWAVAQRLGVAVVSSNSMEAVEHVFHRLAWPTPQVVVGRESVDRQKPDPEGARIALQRLGVPGRRAVLVGDSDYDIQIGRAVGAVTVWVQTGPFRELTHTTPDVTVPNLWALLFLLSEHRLRIDNGAATG